MTLLDTTFDEAPLGEPAAPRSYRAAEGRIDRVGIVFFQLGSGGAPDLNRPRVIGDRTQYHRDVGTVVSRTGQVPADEELWAHFEPPRMRYATLVIRYPTDAAGKVGSDAAAIEFLPWDFGEPTFKRLHAVAAQQRELKRNLGAVDLRVTCSNTQKQHVEVSCAGPAIWRMQEDKQRKLLERATTFYSTVRVGRDITDAELRQRLGLPLCEPLASVDEVDVDDLMRQV